MWRFKIPRPFMQMALAVIVAMSTSGCGLVLHDIIACISGADPQFLCPFTLIRLGPGPTLHCENATYSIAPGTCSILANPCNTEPGGPIDGQWAAGDSVRLYNVPDGVFLETSLSSGFPPTRRLCAEPDAPPVANAPVDYLYSHGSEFGDSDNRQIFVTVTAPLTVQATATPETIDFGAGSSSQLVATVTGGVAPYTYSWTGAGFLVSPRDIANPVVHPQITTVYSVEVNDASGQSASASVVVNVRSNLQVTATPAVIPEPGFSSVLSAAVQGGNPPFSCSWAQFPDSPLSRLVDRTSCQATAFPAFTTTYVVTVRDGAGTEFAGSVSVIVGLRIDATASPASINAGQSSQLTATALGGKTPYSFSWTPSASLIGSNTANPVATPSATTTYTVTVTDAAAASGSATVTVTVVVPPPSGPTACFTFAQLATETVRLDGSCSTGSIVQWR